MKQLKFFATLLVAALSFASCIDDETSRLTPSPATALGEGVFILNQGNQYAKIDGSYSFFDWETNVLSNSVFSTVNGRLLGAGPQDGVVYGSKLYVTLHGSNAVQVMDAKTNKLLRTISTPQPQGVAAYGGHIYVANNTGRVTKIDTLDLQAKQQVEVGPNPVDLMVRNGVLYVSISDGYNLKNGAVNGKRLDKIDLARFRKVGEVKLQATETATLDNGLTQTTITSEGVNPTQMTMDEDGNLFVVCMGDYVQIPAKVWKVDNEEKVSVFAKGNLAAAHRHSLYVINSTTNWKTGEVDVQWDVLETRTGKVLVEKFAQKNLPLDPIAMNVHPRTGRVLVTSRGLLDAKAKYTSPGYLYTYTSKGDLLNRSTVGIEPYAVVFR